MEIVMTRTVKDSINDGRTTQTFEQGHRYEVPTAVGQLWIARGDARAASSETRETGESRPSRPSRKSRTPAHPSPLTPHGGD